MSTIYCREKLHKLYSEIMSPGKKFLLGVLIAAAVASALYVRHLRRETIQVIGAVIMQNEDPRKELPIAEAEVTASDGVSVTRSRSNANGFFAFTFRKRFLQAHPVITLSFRHPDYEPVQMAAKPGGDITVAKLVSLKPVKQVESTAPRQTIGNLTVRYSIKSGTVATVGSAVRSFEVPNVGNIPCNGQAPCSPDGKWKAATGSTLLDAGTGNEFRNARASCIAGPCPFTKIDTTNLERPGRTLSVSVLVWSDTATFLVEAEVVHPMQSDVVRTSYPVIFGDALNFTLPPAAEGVSLQAEVNGQSIVFPLGPALKLSWANCQARANPDETRVYRCELKPEYRWVKSSG
jgi:hypothetical protein